MINSPGFLFWRRPIDSFAPAHSPATLAGLTVYPTASQHVVFSARVGDAKTKRPADLVTCWALCSGDVLLSHGLSPYYHRGCSVSLPCSEWERVVPLRYYHQRLTPKAFGANLWCVIRESRFVTSHLRPLHDSRLNDSRSIKEQRIL